MVGARPAPFLFPMNAKTLVLILMGFIAGFVVGVIYCHAIWHSYLSRNK